MQYAITEQHRQSGETRMIGVIEARNVGEALNSSSIALPDWALGCPINVDQVGRGSIPHPDSEKDVVITAEPVAEQP